MATSRCFSCLVVLLFVLGEVRPTAAAPPPLAADPARQMKLFGQIDLDAYPGMFPCLGDLDGDGQVDFLLYREGPQTTPGYLVAVDHQGKRLWELGDASIASHQPDGVYREPALRGIAMIFDINQDGQSEVIAELWQEGRPMLVVLDGRTGRLQRSQPSPLDLAVRGGRRSRCHPVGRIAFLEGKDRPPAIVLVYGASGMVPTHAVALDAALTTLWHVKEEPVVGGHVPTVADFNGDGREEVMLGTVMLDGQGKVLWRMNVRSHADCTAALDLPNRADKAVLVSLCNTGPAFCLAADGSMLWQKTTQEVSHGQGVWAGDFIEDEPGREVILLRSGHVGDFLTVRAADGSNLSAFKQAIYKGYPDFPCVVNWKSPRVQSLWVPIDRRLVDGRGQTVAELGRWEDLVRQKLQWGTTKSDVAAQAFAVDLCGDAREELVLYQPYRGRAVFLFTQPDSDAKPKPYAPQRNVYNMATYF